MAKRKPKTWVYSPPKLPKVAVPEDLKAEVERKAGELVETVLKPKHVKPPPKNPRFNYLIDLSTKWHGPKSFSLAVRLLPPHGTVSLLIGLANSILSDNHELGKATTAHGLRVEWRSTTMARRQSRSCSPSTGSTPSKW